MVDRKIIDNWRQQVTKHGYHINNTQELIHQYINIPLDVKDIKEAQRFVWWQKEFKHDKEDIIYSYWKSRFKAHVHLMVKDGEDETSRRFVYSDDGCLSYFHLLYRPALMPTKMYAIAHFRSLDVDMIWCDIMGLTMMVGSWCQYFNIYEQCLLRIHIDSLHRYTNENKSSSD